MSAPTATSSFVPPVPTTCVVGSKDLVIPSPKNGPTWAPGTNVVGIAGNDVNNVAFKSCCDGPVHFVPPCALWCEMTPRRNILAELDSCWKSHGLTVEAQFGQLQMSFPGDETPVPGTSSLPGYPVTATSGGSYNYDAAADAYSVGTSTIYDTASNPVSTMTYHEVLAPPPHTAGTNATLMTSTHTPTVVTAYPTGTASLSTGVHSGSATTTTAQTTIPVAAGNSVGVNFGVATAALVMVVKHLLF